MMLFLLSLCYAMQPQSDKNSIEHYNVDELNKDLNYFLAPDERFSEKEKNAVYSHIDAPDLFAQIEHYNVDELNKDLNYFLAPDERFSEKEKNAVYSHIDAPDLFAQNDLLSELNKQNRNDLATVTGSNTSVPVNLNPNFLQASETDINMDKAIREYQEMENEGGLVTYSQIAKKYKIPAGTFWHSLKKDGLIKKNLTTEERLFRAHTSRNLSKESKKRTTNAIDAVCEYQQMQKSGIPFSCTNITKKYGLSRGTFYRALNKANLIKENRSKEDNSQEVRESSSHSFYEKGIEESGLKIACKAVINSGEKLNMEKIEEHSIDEEALRKIANEERDPKIKQRKREGEKIKKIKKENKKEAKMFF